MSVTYMAKVISDGNHASLPIPDEVLAELKGSRRSPLKVTINGHTYQSTATAVSGRCRVVFPSADRLAANVKGGDEVTVHLELDSGHRKVDMHPEFGSVLEARGLRAAFDSLNYSTRKELARFINEAKTDETRMRRIEKAISGL